MTLVIEPQAALLEGPLVRSLPRDEAAPAVSALDELHDCAVARRASDIHIEPAPNGGRARLRVDGCLVSAFHYDPDLTAQLVSRVKVLAAMDVAEKRLPQDGAYRLTTAGRTFDARVASVPTIAGEKLVVRLLEIGLAPPSLRDLGMPEEIARHFGEAVHAPAGFIVICGPTGSGKTTTLYASLGERDAAQEHLCTVEDPVEMRLAGVTQVQVNVRANVTFASALRGFLRADPDVLAIGEMRDADTAQTAIAAALSGRLVLTTLHAGEALQSVERLAGLGPSRVSLAAALTGVLAQRLVRVLCQACRRRVRAGSAWVYEPMGCLCCGGTGYVGRAALFEFVRVGDALRAAIGASASTGALRTIACADDGTDLAHAGRLALERGVTSACEVARVLGCAV